MLSAMRSPIYFQARRGASKLIFSEYGNPSEVLEYHRGLEEEEMVDPSTEIRVRMKYAPVNPADINVIQGVYPTKPESLPAVPGGEGLGEVVEAHSSSRFSVGDWVFPTNRKHGSWRTDIVAKESELVKIRNDIDPIGAATLKINPSTAYLMLKNFTHLKPGDVVIQNGANSGVGRSVIQLAKVMDLITVNVVRKRDDLDILKKDLQDLGADFVLSEEELRSTELFKSKEIPRAKLALNCVGGASSTEIAKSLSFRGKHITYGGMSMKPVIASTSSLIFKDISFHGFWLSRWFEENTAEEASEMLNHLAGFIHNKQLKAPPHKLIPLKDFQEAVSFKGFKNTKYILDMSHE